MEGDPTRHRCHLTLLLFLSTPSGWRATAEPQTQKVVLKISIHALRVEGDLDLYRHISAHRISIHALRVEGDSETNAATSASDAISIHALRVEGDCGSVSARHLLPDFYPRPPGGGRPHRRTRRGSSRIFLSTPSGWRATVRPERRAALCPISIHALRVEGDSFCFVCSTLSANFYPRPPGGGRQGVYMDNKDKLVKFLSTPSGWRATQKADKPGDVDTGISIHALRVEGDAAAGTAQKVKKIDISIHALRVEGDKGAAERYHRAFISIHALRVEGDRSARFSCAAHRHFYPRPPGGGRPYRAFRAVRNRLDFYPRPPGGGRHVRLTRCRWSSAAFLSTPSGWRATILSHHLSDALYISIHALRVEGDYTAMENDELQVIFLSTPSGWRATSATVTVTK